MGREKRGGVEGGWEERGGMESGSEEESRMDKKRQTSPPGTEKALTFCSLPSAKSVTHA